MLDHLNYCNYIYRILSDAKSNQFYGMAKTKTSVRALTSAVLLYLGNDSYVKH